MRGTIARGTRPVLLAGTAVALMACGAAAAPGKRAAAAKVMTLGENAKGHTVTIRRGDELDVRLHSTYWQFASLKGHVLRLLGAPVYKPRVGGGCVPGQGCGTATVRYRANAAGSVTIHASRNSCGEALRCTHGAGSFRVAVKVS